MSGERIVEEDCIVDQVDGLGQINQIGGRYVVLIAGLGDRWFDNRSEAIFAFAAARKGFGLGRASAFSEIRRLIGAKHDY